VPTILYILGWRFFFYSNENKEPIHIHAQKAGKEAKYWLKIKEFEIEEAFSYKLSPKDKRDVKKIIYEHFDYIVEQWSRHFKK